MLKSQLQVKMLSARTLNTPFFFACKLVKYVVTVTRLFLIFSEGKNRVGS